MVAVDPALAEYLYRDMTGTVEELAIVRNDDVASLPDMLEVVLEPLDRYEIDEVGRLVEQ